jgi:hypothetical protein
MELPSGKKSKLEKLENKLYSIDGISSRPRPELKPKKYNVNNDWQEEIDQNNLDYLPKKKMGFFAIVLIVAAVFFVGSLGYASFIFFGNQQTALAQDVDLQIVGPVSVGAGQELLVDVIVTNHNQIPIELVDLYVEYPDGSKNPENLAEELKRITIDMGNFPAGSIKRETIRVALLGEQNTIKDIKFAVQYRISGSNAIFQKKKDFQVTLNATPVYLAVAGLKEISAGQNLELTVSLKSNSTQTLNNIILKGEYPFGFEFESAELKPNLDNNIWFFKELKPAEEKKFKIKGVVNGQNQEDKIFRFNAGLIKDNTEDEVGVLFTMYPHNVKITRPFVDLVIDINKNLGPVSVVNSGTANDATVVFTNNTNDIIKDLEITLEFLGSVLDEKSIGVSSGFYRSIDNTIIWNKETQKIFAELLPRKSVTVGFKFSAVGLASGRDTVKNPQIDINAKVSGKRLATQDKQEEISLTTFKTIKVNSDTPVFAKTYYETGPFDNTGPIPPKVDTPTTYTIEWTLSNSSNDLENAQMTASLPFYVSWKNKFSPNSENISYDSVNRKIVWDLGNVELGTGYGGKMPRQVFMQVELLPSISQKGSNPNLMNDVMLTAKDTFTRAEISRSITSPRTNISSRGIADSHQNVVE